MKNLFNSKEKRKFREYIKGLSKLDRMEFLRRCEANIDSLLSDFRINPSDEDKRYYLESCQYSIKYIKSLNNK